jgi:RNA polymerase sigma factor (sigma-70 family)
MKEEKQLVKQCKKHSHKAFDRLYDAYSPVLFGICLRYARDASSAEDILQEAFLTIFNKIEGYRFEGSFEGWLKRQSIICESKTDIVFPV